MELGNTMFWVLVNKVNIDLVDRGAEKGLRRIYEISYSMTSYTSMNDQH